MISKDSIKHVDKYKAFIKAGERMDRASEAYDAATKTVYTTGKKSGGKLKYYIGLIVLAVGAYYLLS